MNKDLT